MSKKDWRPVVSPLLANQQPHVRAGEMFHIGLENDLAVRYGFSCEPDPARNPGYCRFRRGRFLVSAVDQGWKRQDTQNHQQRAKVFTELFQAVHNDYENGHLTPDGEYTPKYSHN